MTSYELLISDWSSDLCAADLAVLLALDACARAADAARLAISEARLAGAAGALADRAAARRAGYRGVQHPALYRLADDDGAQRDADPVGAAGADSADWRAGDAGSHPRPADRGHGGFGGRGSPHHRARRSLCAGDAAAHYRRCDHRRREIGRAHV